MKRFAYILITLAAAVCLNTACHQQEEWENDAIGNFEALWTIIDQHYCFFAYKDVDWNEVHDRYRAKIGEDITSQELFDICDQMLKELRDGHTNLISSFNTSRYWIWEQYPENYNERLIDQYYLNFDYRRTAGIKYQILSNNIGYMRYGDFSVSFGEGNLDAVFSYLAASDALVIDVRSNGGGYLTNVETLVGRFIDQTIHAGAICHKRGPKHDDFSTPYDYNIKPTKGRVHYNKPVVVLTNRGSYSASNNFVSIMKQLPQVWIVGDTTGGGCGLPFTSELPNGWTIRFSAAPITDADGNLTEFGVEPDLKVDLSSADEAQGRDTMLDAACQLLISKIH